MKIRQFLKTITVLVLCSALLVCTHTPVRADSVSFPDLAGCSATVKNAVNWAAEEGIIKGFSDGTFGPEKSCTRLQFVVMIWRFNGQPSSNASTSFKDVDRSKNTYKAVQWAVGEGIIKGFNDGTFRPDDTVTRQQVAVMLWRMDGEPAASKNVSFPDVKKSGSVYKAVQWGNEEGIIKGYSDGTFGPEKDCQRQHIAIFLYRYSGNASGGSSSGSQGKTAKISGYTKGVSSMEGKEFYTEDQQEVIRLLRQYTEETRWVDDEGCVINSPSIPWDISDQACGEDTGVYETYAQYGLQLYQPMMPRWNSKGFDTLNVEMDCNTYNFENYTRDKAAAAEKKAWDLAASFNYGSDVEKMWRAYSYLCSNVTYDYSFQYEDMYDALILGKSICAGFAAAFDLMCDYMDIDSWIVTGTVENGESHAWNVVEVDGKRYYVDAAFGSSSGNYDRWFLCGTNVRADYCDMGISYSSY